MSDCNGCQVCKVYQGGDCVKGNDFSETNSQSREAIADPEVLKMLKMSSEVESEHYMQWNRLEELIGFCQKMGYERIGVANCVGFAKETALFVKILSQHFTVFSICCKNGGLNKDDYGMPHIQPDRYEATCNPVGQALILDQHKTDANIIFGLCIGHDMVFTQYSGAPVTTFAVKDRVLAHNPMGALYSGYSLRKVLKK